MPDYEALISFLEKQPANGQPTGDLADLAPNLTIDECIGLQIAFKKRLAEKGNPISGYKAAFTSIAAQRATGWDEPLVGLLLASQMKREDEILELHPGMTWAEPEVAAILKRPLAGPNVSPAQALAAIEALFPAFELAPRIVTSKMSKIHLAATHKQGGTIVIGERMTSPSAIDMRLEGMVLSIDGVVQGSGTTIEVLGGPHIVIAAMANKLAAYGEVLPAGMPIMTGCVIGPAAIEQHHREVTAEFATLGRITLRFAPHSAG